MIGSVVIEQFDCWNSIIVYLFCAQGIASIVYNLQVPIVPWMGAISIQVVLCYVGIQTVYFIFFVGYYLSKNDNGSMYNAWVSLRNFVIFTLMSLAVGIFRLVANSYIDGTILYDRIIARWSFVIISIWIVSFLVMICKLNCVERVVNGKVWKLLDKASYPLYLTHYMFLTGPMKVMNWFNGTMNYMVAFFVFTIVTSSFVLFATDWKSVYRILKE